MLARNTLRRVALDGGTPSGRRGEKPRISLHSDRAYLLLSAAASAPEQMRTNLSDAMKIEVHTWRGQHTPMDAAGANGAAANGAEKAR